ncbi:hypothetical protein JW711_04325 [Candidatus Woesearchaeota archaeon]|nr:hypothetical protein [Candidatus Woesearchaeota archaeon]
MKKIRKAAGTVLLSALSAGLLPGTASAGVIPDHARDFSKPTTLEYKFDLGGEGGVSLQYGVRIFSSEQIDKAIEKTLKEKYDFGIVSVRTEDLDDVHKKTFDTAFVLSAVAVFGSTIADIEFTYKNKAACEAELERRIQTEYAQQYPGARLENTGCHDLNPLVDPFLQKGRLAVYTYETGINLIVMGIAYLFKKYIKPPVWLTLPVGVTGTHGYYAVQNVNQYKNKSWNFQITIGF